MGCGLRYKIHYNIEGKPDIVFVSRKIAVFIDSCFGINALSISGDPAQIGNIGIIN